MSTRCKSVRIGRPLKEEENTENKCMENEDKIGQHFLRASG